MGAEGISSERDLGLPGGSVSLETRAADALGAVADKLGQTTNDTATSGAAGGDSRPGYHVSADGGGGDFDSDENINYTTGGGGAKKGKKGGGEGESKDKEPKIPAGDIAYISKQLRVDKEAAAQIIKDGLKLDVLRKGVADESATRMDPEAARADAEEAETLGEELTSEELRERADQINTAVVSEDSSAGTVSEAEDNLLTEAAARREADEIQMVARASASGNSGEAKFEKTDYDKAERNLAAGAYDRGKLRENFDVPLIDMVINKMGLDEETARERIIGGELDVEALRKMPDIEPDKPNPGSVLPEMYHAQKVTELPRGEMGQQVVDYESIATEKVALSALGKEMDSRLEELRQRINETRPRGLGESILYRAVGLGNKAEWFRGISNFADRHGMWKNGRIAEYQSASSQSDKLQELRFSWEKREQENISELDSIQHDYTDLVGFEGKERLEAEQRLLKRIWKLTRNRTSLEDAVQGEIKRVGGFTSEIEREKGFAGFKEGDISKDYQEKLDIINALETGGEITPEMVSLLRSAGILDHMRTIISRLAQRASGNKLDGQGRELWRFWKDNEYLNGMNNLEDEEMVGDEQLARWLTRESGKSLKILAKALREQVMINGTIDERFERGIGQLSSRELFDVLEMKILGAKSIEGAALGVNRTMRISAFNGSVETLGKNIWTRVKRGVSRATQSGFSDYEQGIQNELVQLRGQLVNIRNRNGAGEIAAAQETLRRIVPQLESMRRSGGNRDEIARLEEFVEGLKDNITGFRDMASVQMSATLDELNELSEGRVDFQTSLRDVVEAGTNEFGVAFNAGATAVNALNPGNSELLVDAAIIPVRLLSWGAQSIPGLKNWRFLEKIENNLYSTRRDNFQRESDNNYFWGRVVRGLGGSLGEWANRRFR